MRLAKLLFLVIGISLLVFVLSQADLSQIWREVRSISFAGLALIFFIYTLYFGADVISWQFTFETLPVSLSWARRLFIVRMIGEAYNNITPMGSVGGEPIKAWLLKSNYRVPLTDSGASLILAKTASMFSLVVFVAVALLIALDHPHLSDGHKTMVTVAFSWLLFNVIVFFLMQHLRLSSFTASKLGRSRFGPRLARVISGMEGMDDQFARFYRGHPAKLLASMAFAMMNWMFGVVELYVILSLIGHPISWTDAWLIESMLQLIRAVAFFIPAGIGAQEATLMFAYAAIAGNPTPGIAAALVRRFRELVWISVSLLIGTGFELKPTTASETEVVSEVSS